MATHEAILLRDAKAKYDILRTTLDRRPDFIQYYAAVDEQGKTEALVTITRFAKKFRVQAEAYEDAFSKYRAVVTDYATEEYQSEEADYKRIISDIDDCQILIEEVYEDKESIERKRAKDAEEKRKEEMFKLELEQKRPETECKRRKADQELEFQESMNRIALKKATDDLGLPFQVNSTIWVEPPNGFQGHGDAFPNFQSSFNFPPEHPQQHLNNFLIGGGDGEMESDQQRHGEENLYNRESWSSQHKDYRGKVIQESVHDEETSEDKYGRVIVFSGLNRAKINCDGLFNLLCQYGNVMQIMFHRKIYDIALVQMGSHEYARLAVDKLHGCPLFGHTLVLKMTKESHFRVRQRDVSWR